MSVMGSTHLLLRLSHGWIFDRRSGWTSFRKSWHQFDTAWFCFLTACDDYFAQKRPECCHPANDFWKWWCWNLHSTDHTCTYVSLRQKCDELDHITNLLAINAQISAGLEGLKDTDREGANGAMGRGSVDRCRKQPSCQFVRNAKPAVCR